MAKTGTLHLPKPKSDKGAKPELVVPSDQQIAEYLERERIRKAAELSAVNAIDQGYDKPVVSNPIDLSSLDPAKLRTVAVQPAPPKKWGDTRWLSK